MKKDLLPPESTRKLRKLEGALLECVTAVQVCGWKLATLKSDRDKKLAVINAVSSIDIYLTRVRVACAERVATRAAATAGDDHLLADLLQQRAQAKREGSTSH